MSSRGRAKARRRKRKDVWVEEMKKSETLLGFYFYFLRNVGTCTYFVRRERKILNSDSNKTFGKMDRRKIITTKSYPR